MVKRFITLNCIFSVATMENERTNGKERHREKGAYRENRDVTASLTLPWLAQVNSNTSGCSVAVPRISAFEMEMHPKIRATSPSVPRRRGRPAPTSATRATLLFHNSLRHVSMAPSWVSRSLLLTPFSSCQPAEHVHVLSALLCYGIPVKEPTSRTPKASHYLWQRVKENENGKRGEIIAEGKN